ncbi:MAG: HAD family hydrolase, partial [Acidimicrobiia bacterium]
MDGPVVGFDLDMTLVDSRPGIRASFEALVTETGIEIDIDVALARLGPPLEIELADWTDPARIPELAQRYRALYLA